MQLIAELLNEWKNFGAREENWKNSMLRIRDVDEKFCLCVAVLDLLIIISLGNLALNLRLNFNPRCFI